MAERSTDYSNRSNNEEYNEQEDRYGYAYHAVVYGDPTPEDLIVFLFEQKRGEDDQAATRWETVRTGVSVHKLNDTDLGAFAQAAGQYLNEAYNEVKTDQDLSQDYPYRDDPILEKFLNVQHRLLDHVSDTIVDRSLWVPSRDNPSYDAHGVNRRTLARHASYYLLQQGLYEEIPAEIKTICKPLRRT